MKVGDKFAIVFKIERAAITGEPGPNGSVINNSHGGLYWAKPVQQINEPDPRVILCRDSDPCWFAKAKALADVQSEVEEILKAKSEA